MNKLRFFLIYFLTKVKTNFSKPISLKINRLHLLRSQSVHVFPRQGTNFSHFVHTLSRSLFTFLVDFLKYRIRYLIDFYRVSFFYSVVCSRFYVIICSQFNHGTSFHFAHYHMDFVFLIHSGRLFKTIHI